MKFLAPHGMRLRVWKNATPEDWNSRNRSVISAAVLTAISADIIARARAMPDR